jgi:hypothetical protein
MKIQLPLVLRVQVAFGAVMAVLLVVGIIAYRSVTASSESAQWAQHTSEVLEHLANLRLGPGGRATSSTGGRGKLLHPDAVNQRRSVLS